MLRKLQGRVVCLAPAGEHGAADSLGQAFADAGLVSPAEQQASEALAQEEATQAVADSGSESQAQEPEADVVSEASSSSDKSVKDLEAELTSANAKLLEMSGQVSLLTSMNATLNKEKADMQSAVDKASAEASASAEAAESLKPLAKRQVLVLARGLGEGVDRDALDKMSAAELASKGASMLERFNKAVPDRQVSQIPEDQTQSTETATAPNAHEAGLGNL